VVCVQLLAAAGEFEYWLALDVWIGVRKTLFRVGTVLGDNRTRSRLCTGPTPSSRNGSTRAMVGLRLRYPSTEAEALKLRRERRTIIGMVT
jgi:hypothetical protein